MSAAVIGEDVAAALAELENEFASATDPEPDGVGGAYVTIRGVPLGGRWGAAEAPLTFHLPYNYPAAAPYPYYLPGDLEPTFSWPQALQRVRWRDRDVIQVSLRHNNWDPERDRVVGCVFQVADWLRRQ